MPLTNPSGQIYSNMKALTAKLRDSNSNKASENTKKDVKEFFGYKKAIKTRQLNNTIITTR